MGTAGVFLCVFFGCFVAAFAVIREDGEFPQHRPQFFENLFLFEENFDFPKYDTILSAARTQRPDFYMLEDLPSVPGVPQVEVFCDDVKLTVMVGKRAGRVELTADELQLGDRCYRNHDLPNRHVFAYGVDECGTVRRVDNGVEVFTNTLWINPIRPQTWRPVPSSVRLSCAHKRSFSSPSVFIPTHADKGAVTDFNFRAMDASWTGPARSNVYARGKAIRFQVSAATEPEKQLFIQSCFTSASPEPHSHPRHTVVTNKGCAALLDSSPPAVQFVASKRPNVVRFILNTSLVIPELFVHCTVLLSDRRITSGSKSCNYDAAQLRWEDLSGAREACECCRSKCRGLSLKNAPDEGKAVLSIGPFVVAEDVEAKPGPPPPSSEAADSMQSDASPVEWVASGSAMSTNELAGTLGGVVVASQEPVATLALWLPWQRKDGLEPADDLKEQMERSPKLSNGLLEVKNSVQKRESGNPQTNKIGESSEKIWRPTFGFFGKNSAAEAPLPPEGDGPIMAKLEAPSQRQARPVIRSRLEFSKGTDGSQTLTYEEEVVRKDEDYGSSNCRMKTRGRRGLRSTFLDLIGYVYRAAVEGDSSE